MNLEKDLPKIDNGEPLVVEEQSAGKSPQRRAGVSRLVKDLTSVNLPETCCIDFPNGMDDLMHFNITVRPNEGYYSGGKFIFLFHVSATYPVEPPEVKCKTKVYHPTIDLNGNVGLNILRDGWTSEITINDIISRLHQLFKEPNHEAVLNDDAAAVLRANPNTFFCNVRKAMHGGFVGNTYFDGC